MQARGKSTPRVRRSQRWAGLACGCLLSLGLWSDQALAGRLDLSPRSWALDLVAPPGHHSEKVEDQLLVTRQSLLKTLQGLYEPAVFAGLTEGGRTSLVYDVTQTERAYREVLWYSLGLYETLEARDIQTYDAALSDQVHVGDLMHTSWEDLDRILADKRHTSVDSACAGPPASWTPSMDARVATWRARLVEPYVGLFVPDGSLRLHAKALGKVVVADLAAKGLSSASSRERAFAPQESRRTGQKRRYARALCAAASRLERTWNVLVETFRDDMMRMGTGRLSQAAPVDDVIETVEALTRLSARSSAFAASSLGSTSLQGAWGASR